VVAVALRRGHHFSKAAAFEIDLLAGLGVAGDGHCGARVKHRSRARYNPGLPNLRQVHLIAIELLDELRAGGFELAPGDIGENVTTRGIDLIALPLGTRLRLGPDAIVELTGLRNPCIQMDRFLPGLMAATLDRDADGALVRKAGVMSVVIEPGRVQPGDAIAIVLPDQPHRALGPV
jgi:MOSC domain-containing protein YiiM